MIEKNGDQKCPSCRLVCVYAYYAQWRTVAVTPFCRTLTSGGAAAVDEKVRVDEEEKRRRRCCRLHWEASRHCCRPQSSADISPPRVTTTLPGWPTSSLKYGNAEPSEFHSTTALPAWVAKWPPAAKWGWTIYLQSEGGHWAAGKFIDPTPILGEN